MKQVHFNISDEVYSEFHKLFPSRGEKSTFLRQVLLVAIKNASKKDLFASVVLGKEKERGQSR